MVPSPSRPSVTDDSDPPRADLAIEPAPMAVALALPELAPVPMAIELRPDAVAALPSVVAPGAVDFALEPMAVVSVPVASAPVP